MKENKEYRKYSLVFHFINGRSKTFKYREVQKEECEKILDGFSECVKENKTISFVPEGSHCIVDGVLCTRINPQNVTCLDFIEETKTGRKKE